MTPCYLCGVDAVILPHIEIGAIPAAPLMTAGVGLFGTFSGFVAACFLKPAGQAGATSEVEALRAEVERFRLEFLKLRHGQPPARAKEQ